MQLNSYQKFKRLFLLVFLLVLIGNDLAAKEPQNIKLLKRGPYKVAKVLDGDTIKLETGETVRLIGIDAPESKHPEIPVQRFADEARIYLEERIENFPVHLEINPNDAKDKYQRTLAYVYVGDELLNAKMVERGYAYAYTRFSFARRDEFLALEHEARRKQYGLWDYSLTDGAITHLLNRYDALNLADRKKLDGIIDELVRQYPNKR